MTARDWADEKAKEILHKCRWKDAAYNAEVIALVLRQAHAKGRAEAFEEAAKDARSGLPTSGWTEYIAKHFEAKAKEG